MFRHLILLLLAATLTPAEEWTRFRGPNGTGISSDKGFPVEFGKGKNLIWRTPVRAGKSSPVLTKTRIILTGFENEKLYTMGFDRSSGKLLWEQSEPRKHKQDIQQLNHPAAPSPVTDGNNVYVFFKDYGLLAYDENGKVLWRAPLGPFTNTQGLGASPILAGDSLILQIDQLDNSYLAAYSTRNGELRWKSARQESESWSTPMLYQPSGGPLQIIAAGAGQLGSHRASDGKRMFSYPDASPAMVASPVMSGDTIYAFGYGSDSARPFSFALERYDKNKDGKITPDEYGDNAVMNSIGWYMGNADGAINEEKWIAWGKHVGGYTGLVAVKLENAPAAPRKVWSFDKGFAGVIPSPLLYEGIVYVVKNGGIFSAFDAKTGEALKTGRITGALGGYSASPVLAEGLLYLASEEGKISIVRPGREWEVLHVNDLGDGFFATPALSAGRIYARGSEAMYCFGDERK